VAIEGHVCLGRQLAHPIGRGGVEGVPLVARDVLGLAVDCATRRGTDEVSDPVLPGAFQQVQGA
jgi:hypothetical protein